MPHISDRKPQVERTKLTSLEVLKMPQGRFCIGKGQSTSYSMNDFCDMALGSSVTREDGLCNCSGRTNALFRHPVRRLAREKSVLGEPVCSLSIKLALPIELIMWTDPAREDKYTYHGQSLLEADSRPHSGRPHSGYTRVCRVAHTARCYANPVAIA